MAETSQHPDSLDDLTEPQRDALTWLSNQQGTDPVEPSAEHRRTQTWKALAHRDLVALGDDGTVAMRPAGRALFAENEAPATATAGSADPAVDPAAAAAASGPVVEATTGTGSPSADEVAAAAQPTPAAGTGGTPEMDGTVGEQTGEDADPAPAPDAPAERVVHRLADLRSGDRGVDGELGPYRVLGGPEPLYGTQTGQVRVPVMRVDNGRRAYLRGAPDTAIRQD